MNTRKLRGIIAENDLTGHKIAQMIGITDKTFYAKMKSGNFKLSEAEKLIQILGIKNPGDIFFN